MLSLHSFFAKVSSTAPHSHSFLRLNILEGLGAHAEVAILWSIDYGIATQNCN